MGYDIAMLSHFPSTHREKEVKRKAIRVKCRAVLSEK
jgi:hypothetical protein